MALTLSLLPACSVRTPSGRLTDAGGGARADGSTTPLPPSESCEPSPEGTPDTCSDGVDNDCDHLRDCSDVDCSGVGECPVCGSVDTPLGAPLALPDGVGAGDCATDADCAGGQRCFTIDEDTGARECRESYRSTLSFVGFGGATFDAVSDIRSICVEMEHSWVRDVEIALEAPNGARVRLQRFQGRTGGEIYMGQANDCDSSDAPEPGTGARYCWTPSATREATLDYANAGGALDSAPSCSGFGGDAETLPAGDYSAADDWSTLIGTPLNGDWTLSVTDLWGIDNGYIFEWSIAFDPNAVVDCSAPLI